MSNNPLAIITMENDDKIVVELYPDIAPNTCANFIDLANFGFYNNLQFHRVVKDFVLQGGSIDNTCDGVSDFKIKGEFNANGFENPLEHVDGVISMARDDDFDSADTQFFIMHKSSKRLDGNYAAFGKTIEGIDIIDKIANVETQGKENTPISKQVIKSIVIELNGHSNVVPKRIY